MTSVLGTNPPVDRSLRTRPGAEELASALLPGTEGRRKRKFPANIRTASRSIRSLPGIRVRSSTRGQGPVLLLVREHCAEDRTWAEEEGQALMAAGRAAWVVEIRDSELLPDDSPEYIQKALHSHALLWPEWRLAYGSGQVAERDLAEAFVAYCRRRERWGDPVILDSIRGVDDLFGILKGTPAGAFREMFFRVKAGKEASDG